nr:energy transducer TonB [uncultured Marinifilum sp.]
MHKILFALILILFPVVCVAQNDTIVYFKNHKPLPTKEGADFRVTVKKKNNKTSIMVEDIYSNGEWENLVNRSIKLKDDNSYLVKYENKSFTRKFNKITGGYLVEDYNYKGELWKKGIATNLFPLIKHGQWTSYTDDIITEVNSYKNGVLIKSFITDNKKHYWPNNTYANADTLARYKESLLDLSKDIVRFVKYPESCAKKGIGGCVLILFAISEQGEPCDISIFRGVHSELNKAAAMAVQQCKAWKPAIKNGLPVKLYTIVPVNFKLN